jgi:hypothetical protein
MLALVPVKWLASQVLLLTLGAAAPQATGELTPGQVARALAGQPVAAIAADPRKGPLLESHGNRIARAWAAYEQRLGGPLAAWAKEALDPLPEGTLFYPFSGPDFVTAHRLWPDATRYVFVAYQPCGRVPPLGRQDAAAFGRTLQWFREGIDGFAGLGFFVTSSMNDRLGAADQGVEGNLGIMMAFAALEGFEVLDAQPIRVREDGADVEPHPGRRDKAATWDSVRLHLRRRADGGRVLLDYVRVDLSNGKLDKRPNEKRWVDEQCRFPTLLKAASFLLHRPGFSYLHERLLARAPSILQDETAVPWRALARTFEVRLFGRFDGFHERFLERSLDEVALRKAYHQPGAAEPLPFRLGYDVRRAAGFQYAHRRKDATSAQP